MGLYAIRKNGQLQLGGGLLVVSGSTSVAAISFTDVTKPAGIYEPSSGHVGLVNNGVNTASFAQGEMRMAAATVLSWNNNVNASAAAPDTQIQRIAANRIGIIGADSTTAGTIRAGTFEFSAAASTFAQTATITNGPRAANPVSWVRVTFNNGGSSGRVPIW